ncbi:hypothetical protein Asppvi_009824 [Aspergillus pseudoviridinutans]|uniref:Uncharacterized protein n=1 Tax=Aspergillus pseudoviridinutans TaxID=1517512 RepID=A0A9P3BIE0_9EURO|nr:uncharacterized protein Asppvi_009824 [Aspergillus pseudoviridinutans]GIJ90859.1 hypothetical protein Asppvi_009824 [Aspergillus pseudoviridinutans]
MNITCLPDDLRDAALKTAAETLIQCLQAMPELQGAKVAIVGGMAVQNYLTGYRRTYDVDVLLFRPDRPIDYQLMRKELVSLSQHKRKPKYSYFVQVDIIPEYLPPYLPAQAMTLEDVDIGHLPFLDPLDLLACKVHCSSMRSSLRKRKQDADDAVKLCETYYGQEYVPPSKEQRDAIASGVDLMAEFSRRSHWRKWRLRQWVKSVRGAACGWVQSAGQRLI